MTDLLQLSARYIDEGQRDAPKMMNPTYMAQPVSRRRTKQGRVMPEYHPKATWLDI